jgi:hypothetical protein
MPLKITSWNVEYADKLLKDNTAAGNDRKKRIRQTLAAIDPDIICIVEGPKGEKGAVSFGTQVLGGDWEPVLLSDEGGAVGSRDRDYGNNMTGIQWVWFFVKPGLKDRCRIQPPSVWQQLTGCTEWKVYLWGKPKAKVSHKHYRHPQVMTYDFGNGSKMELIGVHLKSGFMQTKIERDADGNIIGAYLDEALTNRIKLATEARDVRDYISKRFDEEQKPPAIIVLGDANDGPAQDYFETNYLFFSVVSNLEGNVLEAEEYFNHALFDFDAAMRWSIRFADEVTGLSKEENPLLLDHILMSQPLCNGAYPVRANGGAGAVEHAAWQDNNPKGKTETSDHRPVSIVLEDS